MRLPSIVAGERARAQPAPRHETSIEVKPNRFGVGPTGSWLRGLVGIVLLALLWEFAPQAGLVDSYFFPPLHQVLQTLWSMAVDGELWKHLRASLIRAGVGFTLAVVVAVPVGAAVAWYRPVREVLTPVLEFFRNTAALALLPAFTLLLGIGETSKFAIVTYTCFFPVLLSTIAGIGTVDPQLLRSARVLGLSPVALFRKVAFPAAVPTIFTGIRISGAASILVLIAAEMIGANSGIGFLINYSQNNFLIPKMYAGILTTSLLGLAVNYALVGLERRFSRWRG